LSVSTNILGNISCHDTDVRE